MIKLQDKDLKIDAPIEVDFICNSMRLMFLELDWLSHGYNIANALYRNGTKLKFQRVQGNSKFVYPETYAGPEGQDYGYHRLTPDNDYSGMVFFVIGNEEYRFNDINIDSLVGYDVSAIFSVNLELIDKERLQKGLFTQELIRDVRRLLRKYDGSFKFQYRLQRVSRDIRQVYREFILDEKEQYNRAPMQCFRFDFRVAIWEDCLTDEELS